ncbi:DNA/RNA nuclease SfsA [Roseiarcaceae bacterium H3SJ34-1]|uniref:DNA/RNA nuclease SfsA n=1 Tax=Terripilifer ovatus TaxID=3032367 RepID=UPI003AB96EE0|nr:DNA/RNA nuclease SfsA [Roseiarcaceae bacterium H3SJ34-1]
MQFDPPLVSGRLIQRYKRFLADVLLDSGEEIIAHCANPGAMLGLIAPGNRVFLSRSDNPARKLKYSWEIVETDFGRGPEFVGINTSHPNALVFDAIAAGFFPEFAGYTSARREVKYGRNSRVDILLTGDGETANLPPCYVEIKNVHMMRRPGLAEFPDSVTARGAKHLLELGDMVAAGSRAVMIYLVQMQADAFTLAADIDPTYAKAFALAQARGVEAMAACCKVSPRGVVVDRRVPLIGVAAGGTGTS